MAIPKKRLQAIEAIKDKDINYSDIPELNDDFWQHAELKIPAPKQGVYIRLDGDVLAWFKDQGRGYQTRINAILRSYYDAKQNEASHNKK